MIIATRQTKMIFPDEETFCPMTTIGGVRDRLPGHNEDDVLALIEEQPIRLPWAWDISVAHADRLRNVTDNPRERREVRLLTAGVDHFKRTGKKLDWPWHRVLEDVLRGYCKPWITGTRAQIILNCSSTHVVSLVQSRQLAILPGTSWSSGPGNSPQIVTDSFISFLTQRLIIQVREVQS